MTCLEGIFGLVFAVRISRISYIYTIILPMMVKHRTHMKITCDYSCWEGQANNHAQINKFETFHTSVIQGLKKHEYWHQNLSCTSCTLKMAKMCQEDMFANKSSKPERQNMSINCFVFLCTSPHWVTQRDLWTCFPWWKYMKAPSRNHIGQELSQLIFMFFLPVAVFGACKHSS